MHGTRISGVSANALKYVCFKRAILNATESTFNGLQSTRAVGLCSRVAVWYGGITAWQCVFSCLPKKYRNATCEAGAAVLQRGK
jgi:hypothetical protein